MATLNVNRNVTDSFYRYKMPKLLAKVEGKGNGIKTVIVNMVDVAKALGRPPTCEYKQKFFFFKLKYLYLNFIIKVYQINILLVDFYYISLILIADPCKFFGCELGAQTQFDFKNDRYIVNGSHDSTKLQGLLDIFIKKFVLCPECENPETDLLPNVSTVILSILSVVMIVLLLGSLPSAKVIFDYKVMLIFSVIHYFYISSNTHLPKKPHYLFQ